MKQTFTLFFLLLVFAISAQENNVPDTSKSHELKNEIGINLFNVNNLSNCINGTVNYNFAYSYLNGIMYKRYFNKNVLRIGFDYFHYDIRGDFFLLSNIISVRSGRYDIGKLKLGYERKLTETREQLFTAIDLNMAYGKGKNFKYNYMYNSPIGNEEENIKIAEVGIEPAIGVNFRFSRRFSLTIETSIRLYYAYIKGDIGQHSALLFTFNPVRLFSFNFHC